MNYAQMKKDELIKVLKEKDSVIAGFEETKKLLSKENDDLTVKVNSLTQDCKGMTKQCNTLHNTINGLENDIAKSNEICTRLISEKEALRIEKNALKTTVDSKENVITTLKRQRVILGLITIVAILIAIIF